MLYVYIHVTYLASFRADMYACPSPQPEPTWKDTPITDKKVGLNRYFSIRKLGLKPSAKDSIPDRPREAATDSRWGVSDRCAPNFLEKRQTLWVSSVYSIRYIGVVSVVSQYNCVYYCDTLCLLL
jgi:hypothetical protein